MRYSFCTIAYRHSSLPLAEIIKRISLMGYEGIEIWWPHLLANSNLDLKKILKQHNLSVSAISPYFNFTAGAAKWKKSLLVAERVIEVASSLACPFIRCFTGRIGSREATGGMWEDAISGIRMAADLAKSKNIDIIIETHPDTLSDSLGSIKRLLQRVERKNIGLIFDFYNMWELEKEMLNRSFQGLYPFVKHLHLKNAKTGGIKESPFSLVAKKKTDLSPISFLKEGDVDYLPLLNFIKKKRFNGFLSVEWFGNNIEDAAAHELLYLKKILGANP